MAANHIFYSNRDYNTMIEPHFRDSRSDLVTAASAAIDLLKNAEVIAIIGRKNPFNGSRLVPYLTVDLLKSNAVVSHQSVISSNATGDRIRQELFKLMKMRTRVFVVHMLPGLASRFFNVAKEAGMMDKGYAWLIADVLTSLLDSMDPQTMETMQGVLGVKAYIPESIKLMDFKKRWRKRFHTEYPEMDGTELNVNSKRAA